jgi:hypothetical protein
MTSSSFLDEVQHAFESFHHIQHFVARLRELFLSCPIGREQVIAEHACQKYSGRVGRTADAKALDEKTIRLAVIAHIRHSLRVGSVRWRVNR